jgi:hypothetical protein
MRALIGLMWLLHWLPLPIRALGEALGGCSISICVRVAASP